MLSRIGCPSTDLVLGWDGESIAFSVSRRRSAVSADRNVLPRYTILFASMSPTSVLIPLGRDWPCAPRASTGDHGAQW